MSVNSKMTALADEIRELSGISESIGLDAMKTHVSEANDEVASQVELLAQAVAALEGKAGASNSSSGIETCQVTMEKGDLGNSSWYIRFLNKNLEYQKVSQVMQYGDTITIEVVKNSFFALNQNYDPRLVIDGYYTDNTKNTLWHIAIGDMNIEIG